MLTGASVHAQNDDMAKSRHLDSIVVKGKRRADPAVDEAVRREVATALHDDPYFYDGHVTVSVVNGVVTLEGIVFDDWDLRTAMRIARRMAGGRKVVNDLEIKLGGEYRPASMRAFGGSLRKQVDADDDEHDQHRRHGIAAQREAAGR